MRTDRFPMRSEDVEEFDECDSFSAAVVAGNVVVFVVGRRGLSVVMSASLEETTPRVTRAARSIRIINVRPNSNPYLRNVPI